MGCIDFKCGSDVTLPPLIGFMEQRHAVDHHLQADASVRPHDHSKPPLLCCHFCSLAVVQSCIMIAVSNLGPLCLLSRKNLLVLPRGYCYHRVCHEGIGTARMNKIKFLIASDE